jgi:hypothetical protein
MNTGNEKYEESDLDSPSDEDGAEHAQHRKKSRNNKRYCTPHNGTNLYCSKFIDFFFAQF